jgi:ATP-dependent DNA ligase
MHPRRGVRAAFPPQRARLDGRFARAAFSLKAASCLIDGEAVVCDDNRYSTGCATGAMTVVSFFTPYLIELDGDDLRRESIERRKCW